MLTTEDNISAVRRMIETDKRVTYQQSQTNLGIRMSQLHKILHEHLPVRKLCTRWIPHNLSEAWSCVEVLAHLPYSPGVTLCDFYFIPKIKGKLRKKWFTDVEEAGTGYEKSVEAMCFSQWFHLMQRHIYLNGHYFEKQ
ncbi:hypothetical protein EVAR_36434_1 [Eumeta japonica]|uniref:Histone-lysine N-methyltransferase SETMAR n=1 Tax=Eumeta variegata TaxID=151549 RepID=A0A4C1VNM6_EUMVA|nr:hypothetical protein EVAR_36434_1 [Eumeta japonica]